MTLEDINDVEFEIKRFQKRIKAAKERIKTDKYFFFGCNESGALKRGALDLKHELTKITR